MFAKTALNVIGKRTHRKVTFFMAEVKGLPGKLYLYTEESPYFHVNSTIDKKDEAIEKAKRIIDNYYEILKHDAEREKSRNSG